MIMNTRLGKMLACGIVAGNWLGVGIMCTFWLYQYIMKKHRVKSLKTA